MEAIRQFSAQHPNIPLYSPTSPSFASHRKIYNTASTATPLSIAVPKTAEDVSSIIKYSVANNVPLSFRAGGHDPLGRTCVSDTLFVDLRGLDFVSINESKMTVTVGGGVLSGALAKKLEEKGMVVPLGSVPWVGYVGYCTMGGYGLFTGHLGLGVDGIVAAKIVTAKGDIVEAGEELLKGIRGAGGNFGVIVEMTVRTYKLEKILTGTIVFEASDIARSLKQYYANLAELEKREQRPSCLELQLLIVNTPMGRALGILYLWSSPDMELGRAWADKIMGLGTAVFNDLAETTLSQSMEGAAKVVPEFAYGERSRSINLREITPEVVGIISRYAEKLPKDFGTCMSVHDMTGKSAKETDSSVFAAREKHYMVEIIASVVDKENAKETGQWADEFYRELREKAKDQLLESTWVPMTQDAELDVKKVFGKNYELVMALKRKYDPENVFRNVLPRLM